VRWFIVFLIVANVILFFWVQQQSRPLPGLATLPSPDIGRLRLLSEVDGETVHDDAGSEPSTAESEPSTVGAEPVKSTEPSGVEPEQETSVEPLVAATTATPEPVQKLSQMPLDQVAESGTGTEMVTEVAEEHTGDPTLSPAGSGDEGTEQVLENTAGPLAEDVAKELGQPVAQVKESATGISELESRVALSPAEQQEAEALSDPAPPAAEAQQVVCARVGPLESDQADALIAGLPASVSLLSDINEDTAIVDRYYVLIPTLPSRAAGRQKLKELTDAGVTDTWLFPSGEFRNAISLGFFSREAGANRHAANIAKKGFTTEVTGRTSIRKRRWLLLKRADGSDPASELALPAAAGSERRDCP